jgi:uncharacterized protein YdiU (UPF0061 family)
MNFLMDTAYTSQLVADGHRRATNNESLQNELSRVTLEERRAGTDLHKIEANLERLHVAKNDSIQKLNQYTNSSSINLRETKSLNVRLRALEDEIVRLNLESGALERDAEYEEAMSEKLMAVRVGVKRDAAKCQRLLVSQVQKLNNLSIQVDSAAATLSLVAQSTKTKAEQLLRLQKDVKNLKVALSARNS